MSKFTNFLSLFIGNMLTLGAIFVYATQSQTKVELGTYGLVMVLFSTLLITVFYVWSDTKKPMINRFLE
ncbi:hypothetical protein AEA09_05965 [Lysinibacillus contaminans]|uniref:Uncharacterized protein n=1 Tax=Lysinibacillus contaminans TaxID=1293441 RepID=A0ABR5K0C1_9BACI|nr:hypothetical protein [Lysinibacillus contaminans]KOS68145.1 hypothetical protein AEA09_05965 [Lysinibacillus contaminans]